MILKSFQLRIDSLHQIYLMMPTTGIKNNQCKTLAQITMTRMIQFFSSLTGDVNPVISALLTTGTKI